VNGTVRMPQSGLLTTRFPERHERVAPMLVSPCLFTSGMQGNDYLSARGSRNKGAAVKRADQVAGIIAVVANAAE
jgi:hypothetical protein